MVLVSLAGAACTADAGEPVAEVAEEAETDVTSVETAPAADQDDAADVVENPDPVVRVPENPGTDDGGFWVGWAAMDESMVQLTWSEADLGGDDPVGYRLYRVETVGTDVSAVELTADNLVYRGNAQSFIDTDLQPETFYTYIAVAQSGKLVSPRRWTEVLTVTDTTPPTGITGLTASRTSEGVLLTWDLSSDDVEFGAYSVSVVDGDELSYIGGGADESQNSFLDPQAPDGPVTYAVQAVDFHNNRTEPALISVE